MASSKTTAVGLRAGFVGLGDMGRPMAERLVAGGVETTVFDVVEAPVQELVQQGAKAGASPREVAAAGQGVGVCVRDDDDVRAVCLGDQGILAGAAPGTVVAIHSTVLPTTVEGVAAAAPRGVSILDACVTGGAARARAGQLTYLVGGEAEALEKARPYLETSSAKIIHTGALGNGCKTKLCLNLVTYLQWTAAFESFPLARAIGLPTDVLEEAGTANGQFTELMRQFLMGQKLPDEVRRSEGFQKQMRGFMKVAEKDLAWTLSLAREAGVALPGTAAASQIMARIYGVEDPNRR